MLPSRCFKPSLLLGELRIPLNPSETKMCHIGQEPEVEETNNFCQTSAIIKFYTKIRIVDRKTNAYVSLRYADLLQLRENLSALIIPTKEHQDTCKYPLVLSSIEISKITDDLYCITSLVPEDDNKIGKILIGKISLEKLLKESKLLADAYIQLETISGALSNTIHNDILLILEKQEMKTFETVEDMLGQLDEMDLPESLLRSEMLLKYPNMYFAILSNLKY